MHVVPGSTHSWTTTRGFSLPIRRVFSGALAILAGTVVALVVAEFLARFLEPDHTKEGDFYNVPHETVGWIPKPDSQAVETTDEFTARYRINALGMNDLPVAGQRNSRLRIVALGDSHTFAMGVNMDETWPNVLENLLFGGESDAGTVFNLGVIGYNLGQYYDWLLINEKRLSPDVVIIGFSMATDLYDLIPPRKGGFVYGKGADRYYYDLSEDGELLRLRSNVSQGTTSPQVRDVRTHLNRLALYRLLKRSKLAYWLSVRLSPGGQSLWPGLDTALKRELSGDDAYRWRLAERILTALVEDAGSRARRVVLVVIPYLAQVYDEVWESSFGSFPDKYDRWIGNRRLRELAERLGIGFVDTTPDFVQRVRESGEWLHYRRDGHPNPRGHAVIAAAVARYWRTLEAP